MNRYFYYLIIINMIVHVVTSVPNILFGARMHGAIFSLILSLAAGVLATYWFASFFTKFPGKGYPELLKEYTAKWFAYPFLLLVFLVWFLAGLITLITYSFVLKLFLTPDMPLPMILSILLCFISLGILMNTKSVLYTVEIILFLNIPFILYIFFKMYFDKGMNWDFVREAMMYIGHVPNISAFSAALYLFLGAANLIVFNRVFVRKQTITGKQLVILGIAGGFALFTSYFIPIGFQGFMHIDRLSHPWFLTADSIRMDYGFIERVLFLFLILNLAISFLSILIHWHVAIEVLKSVVWFKRLCWKEYNLTPWLFVAGFWVSSLIIVPYLNDHQIALYTKYLLNAFFPFTGIVLLSLLWIKRRAKA